VVGHGVRKTEPDHSNWDSVYEADGVRISPTEARATEVRTFEVAFSL